MSDYLPETTIINTIQGREAEKIYAIVTQSCGAIFDMDDYLAKENNRKYDIKMVTRGRCMMCGKDLTEGLFFCKECEEKAKEDDKNDKNSMRYLW